MTGRQTDLLFYTHFFVAIVSQYGIPPFVLQFLRIVLLEIVFIIFTVGFRILISAVLPSPGTISNLDGLVIA